MKSMIFVKSKKGFTLIEFAIVIVMAAILASVAMPIYLGFTDGAKWTEAITAVSTLKRSVETYSTKFGGDISGLAEGDGNNLSFDKLKLDSTAFTVLQFFDAGDFQFQYETDGTDGNFLIYVDASFDNTGGLSSAGPQDGIGYYKSSDRTWNGRLK